MTDYSISATESVIWCTNIEDDWLHVNIDVNNIRDVGSKRHYGIGEMQTKQTRLSQSVSQSVSPSRSEVSPRIVWSKCHFLIVYLFKTRHSYHRIWWSILFRIATIIDLFDCTQSKFRTMASTRLYRFPAWNRAIPQYSSRSAQVVSCLSRARTSRCYSSKNASKDQFMIWRPWLRIAIGVPFIGALIYSMVWQLFSPKTKLQWR